jgi:hypothetical protein
MYEKREDEQSIQARLSMLAGGWRHQRLNLLGCSHLEYLYTAIYDNFRPILSKI